MGSSCGSSCGEEMFKCGLTEEKCGRQGMDNGVTNSFTMAKWQFWEGSGVFNLSIEAPAVCQALYLA